MINIKLEHKHELYTHLIIWWRNLNPDIRDLYKSIYNKKEHLLEIYLDAENININNIVSYCPNKEEAIILLNYEYDNKLNSGLMDSYSNIFIGTLISFTTYKDTDITHSTYSKNEYANKPVPWSLLLYIAHDYYKQYFLNE